MRKQLRFEFRPTIPCDIPQETCVRERPRVAGRGVKQAGGDQGQVATAAVNDCEKERGHSIHGMIQRPLGLVRKAVVLQLVISMPPIWRREIRLLPCLEWADSAW